MKRVAFIALIPFITLGTLVARPAPALAAGGDNNAIAINTRDGTYLFKLAFSIKRAAAQTVDDQNAAVAVASCDSCDTVAVAIEVVLATGDPRVVTPTNLAYAYNLECDNCQTLAYADQYVLGTGGPVHFTAAGNRHIAEIRRELLELKRANLPIDVVSSRVSSIILELNAVIATELVRVS
jgi:putative peptide zinc metalloprotease protein